jgi:hypothetical protein
MWIELLSGNHELFNRYAKIREKMATSAIGSYLQLLRNFFLDLALLFASPCLRLCGRRRSRERGREEVMDFFLRKLGRVEIAWGEDLYQYDFMVYP